MQRRGLREPAATIPGSRLRANDGRTGIAGILVAPIVAMLFITASFAREAVPESSDPALEARMVHVTSELRCLVCQNQTIADSHADLAVDLRAQVREQLKAGRSDADIIDYMTARYGDFVLYRPPFKPTTALLWLGPGLMLAIGVIALTIVLRRRDRLAAEAFEVDEDDDLVAADARPAARHRPCLTPSSSPRLRRSARGCARSRSCTRRAAWTTRRTKRRGARPSAC